MFFLSQRVTFHYFWRCKQFPFGASAIVFDIFNLEHFTQQVKYFGLIKTTPETTGNLLYKTWHDWFMGMRLNKIHDKISFHGNISVGFALEYLYIEIVDDFRRETFDRYRINFSHKICDVFIMHMDFCHCLAVNCCFLIHY